MIRVNGLSKKYKDIEAVSDLSLSVNRGDIYGLLGPNGSGKSTTIRLLLSLVFPDKGDIYMFGLPLQNNRTKILKQTGALVEKPDFYEHLSAMKNLQMLSIYSGFQVDDKKILATLELVGLAERAHSKVKTYSKGMKQRLGLAQALVHDPELLILDEPASGLDPSGVRDIRNLLMYLNKDLNKTIILSSHQLHEIEMLSNRMIIINKGKKVTEGEVEKLLVNHSYYTSFRLDDKQKALKLLKTSNFDIDKIEDDVNAIRIYCKREIIPLINQYLVENHILIYSIQVEQSLEDYFLTLT